MPVTDIEVTELIEIDPSRVDAVGSPANGTDWLILKALGGGEVEETEATLDDVLAELDKAAKPAACPLCHGEKTIRGGNMKCPKCKGTGVAPKVGDTEKSLAEKASSGAAPSGAPGSNAGSDCDTCHGTGMVGDDPCPDCDGAKFDPSVEQDGFAGSMQVGDSREAVDKAVEERYGITEAEYLSKKNMDPNVGGGVDRDKLDASDFAGKNRSFPIVTPGDVQDAASSIGRAGSDNYSSDKLKANIIRIAKRKGASFVAKLPKAWTDDANKGVVEKDGVVSGPNPFLNGSMNSSTTDANTTDDDDDAATPGSPDWEGMDADIATAAATALLEAAELIRQFADREAIEVAAGEGNDVFDTWDAQCALDAVTAAVGMMATLAFHEGVAAQKSEGVAEKAGKRLSTKSVTALAAARDHLTKLLGDDDPAKSSDDDDATKAILAKEIEDMTGDELTKVLDGREEKLVGMLTKALKKAGKPAMDEKNSVVNGKAANAKAKTKKPKADNQDLEDESDAGEDDNGSTDAAKAELTPEQIEARKARKTATKQLRKAKRDEKKAAKVAAIAKAIEDGVAKATNSLAEVDALKDRLATVEKMAAPSTIVRTAPKEAVAKATERDTLDAEIARLENVVKSTTDKDIRSGSLDRLKELKAKRAAL